MASDYTGEIRAGDVVTCLDSEGAPFFDGQTCTVAKTEAGLVSILGDSADHLWSPTRFVRAAPSPAPAPAQDPISPPHYARYKIEPITFIMENKLPYAVGNVVKYVCRFDAKNGLEDLRKAKRYVEYLIEEAERGAA